MDKDTQAKKDIEATCFSIMENIVNYLSDEVYVEKLENAYIIKSFNNENKKNFSIRINRSDFQFDLNKSSGIVHATFTLGISNNPKDKIYDSGSFNVKISNELFNLHEKWITDKAEEYLLFKMKSLESNLYKDFNIDKKLKRKKINNILNKKEDL
jgi:hypothetical protein